MASKLPQNVKSPPPTCSICQSVVRSKSYQNISWEKHSNFQHLFREIGHAVDYRQNICQPCNSLFQRRLRLEHDYDNRHQSLHHLRKDRCPCITSPILTSGNHWFECQLLLDARMGGCRTDGLRGLLLGWPYKRGTTVMG